MVMVAIVVAVLVSREAPCNTFSCVSIATNERSCYLFHGI
jgi:hypothetical protein